MDEFEEGSGVTRYCVLLLALCNDSNVIFLFGAGRVGHVRERGWEKEDGPTFRWAQARVG